MPRKAKSTPQGSIQIRMDRDLLEEIRLAAERDDRSMNSYIVASVRRQLQQLMPEQIRKRERR